MIILTMEKKYLPFEKDVESLDKEISELIKYGKQKGIDSSWDVEKKKSERITLLTDIYSNLDNWQTVQVARHPQRLLLSDYLNELVYDFREIHGDRVYGDDRALIGGFGRIGRDHFMIIGHNKGKNTRENGERNFGCPNPEGFRKANRLMRLAEKYGVPILTFIDTPGAHPGIGAEERGQASAISQNLAYMPRVKVPIICVGIGEGGSGGALGIGVGNKLAALEYSYYSVISPEGCAGILWRDGNKKEEAAEELKLSASNGYRLGAIDDIIEEPIGGAHRNPHDTFVNVGQYIYQSIRELEKMDADELIEQRWKAIKRRVKGERD